VENKLTGKKGVIIDAGYSWHSILATARAGRFLK
jgi:hypothetical protein